MTPHVARDSLKKWYRQYRWFQRDRDDKSQGDVHIYVQRDEKVAE